MDATWSWTKPPKSMVPEVRSWGERLLQALLDLGKAIALKFEKYARAKAKWTDRTSHARAGLTARAVRFGAIVVVYLFHTMTYGWYLETAMAKRFAILMPTVNAHLAEIMAALRRLGTR